MSSGVSVDDLCFSAFEQLKMKRSSSFIIYGFDERDETIEVKYEDRSNSRGDCEDGKKQAPNDHWNRMVSMLPKDDVCYVVSYVHYRIDGRAQTDIVFVLWAPDSAAVRRKMLVTSSSAALKPGLLGIKTTVQANCKADLDITSIVCERLRGTMVM